ncbi:MAG: glycoside hydrolase family 9 protein, partial [Janthinobacterium lividum]
GVFHKQTSEHFCAFIMPQDDHLVSEVIGTGAAPYKSTCATADLAAVMAIAARCYAEFDSSLALRFRTAAEKAWQWAMAHPEVPFDNPPGILTGSYADPHCSDELAWASAELWRTTGETKYERVFLASVPTDRSTLVIGVPSWGSVASMACWTYALASRPGELGVKEAIRAKTQETAQKLISQGQANGYGNTMVAEDYIWGSNSVAANQSLLLLMADQFTPNPEAIGAALNNLHYLLGRNCFGVSWVTQVGRRPFMHPHHRPSVADGIVAPWPGLLSGGPNRHPGDAAALRLPSMPPMRMWIDDDQAYSMNEIAINWNAPLVFTLAAANSLPRL